MHRKTAINTRAGVIAGLLAAATAGALDDLDLKLEEWALTAEIQSVNCLGARDALQQRHDYDYNADPEWERGDVSGGGFGLRFTATKDQVGSLCLALRQAGIDYEFVTQDRFSSQAITSERFDFDLAWFEVNKETEHARRGWLAGIRYIGTAKDVRIYEGVNRNVVVDTTAPPYITLDPPLLPQGGGVIIPAGPPQLAYDGEVNWKLLHGGYFGEFRPFGWRVKLWGMIGFLLGEVDGIAREGSDTAWSNGMVEEAYQEKSSWAYGLDLAAMLTLDLHRNVAVGVGYNREWLYSFDATDTGMAVYPDNDDALFIENSEYLTMQIVGMF